MLPTRSSSVRRAIAVGATLALLAPLAALASNGPSGGPAPGSPAYILRDTENIADAYSRQTAPDGQLTPTYVAALNKSMGALWAAQLFAQAAEPTRPALSPGQFVPGWNSGNPYRVDWAGKRGAMIPVAFTNRYGALLRGDMFAPLPGANDPYTGRPLHAPYPGVVITTGSVQGSERMYWWLAQDLAERGYVVLTYDVQGQGTSETLGHEGPVADLPYCDLSAPTAPGELSPCPGLPFQQTANFVYGTEDAITFFLSTPSRRYPNADAGTARVNSYNPLWRLFDRTPDTRTVTPGRTTRLAIAGHSLGAVAVSYVQAVDKRVEAIVALDKLTTDSAIYGPEFTTKGPLKPVVPGLGVQSEYGFNVAPYFANPGLFHPTSAGPTSPEQAPDPYREEKSGFTGWQRAHVDTMVVVPRASTHLEYTDIPFVLPASRYGQDVASHYAQAWFDKYLKHDPAADNALTASTFRYLEPVDIGVWQPVTLHRADRLSFYFCSGYDFTTAAGARVRNGDVGHVGCK